MEIFILGKGESEKGRWMYNEYDFETRDGKCGTWVTQADKPIGEWIKVRDNIKVEVWWYPEVKWNIDPNEYGKYNKRK